MSVSTYQVTFHSPEIKTLGGYCKEQDSPAFKYKDNESELLEIRNPSGLTNREVIFNSYTVREEKDNNSKSPKDLLLKVGTILSIPVGKASVEGLLSHGIEVVSNDEGIFKAKALAALESDIGYIKVFNSSKHEELGTTSVQSPNITVWIWSRALSVSDDDLEGELIDVTPFISKLETFVGKNGGNFSLTLPPLVCKLKRTVEGGKVHQRWEVSGDLNLSEDSYLSDESLFKDDKLSRNEFFFSDTLQDNDLVFIRHETLEMEKVQRIKDGSLLGLTKFNLPGRIYDMIGLVDTNTTSISPEGNNVTIEIKGRDLVKLFIDDGVYFYNLENLQGQFRLAGANSTKNDLTRRIIGTNALYYLNLFQNNSIENILKFVIQQLSTISIAPDSLFEAYGDRRNTTFLDVEKTTTPSTKSESTQQDKADSIELIRRTLEELNVTADESEVYEYFYQFLRQIRDNKSRIIYLNKTLGWTANKISTPTTVPPFTTNSSFERLEENDLPEFIYTYKFLNTGQKYNSLRISQLHIVNIFDQVDKQIDNENSPQSTSPDNKKILCKGIWQIIKLVIDKGVVGRRLIDSSLSTDQGSLLNFVRKVAKEPFVEFYCDTYGDQFHLIVRKPPFDKVSMQNLLKNKINTEEGEVNVLNSIVDVELHDVINESIHFDSTEAYSWYRFEPKNIGSTGGNTLTTLYTPAIYFEEYAKIWGSRPLVVEHNYNPYISSVTEDGVTDISRFEEQALYDLKYLIESHAHLPFTRQGNITINRDRRLKRGSFIRYKPTGEIYHIDSVQHSTSISDSSIDATTSLTLSRGMVERLIDGIVVNGVRIGYFDIINTEIQVEKKKYQDETKFVTRTILKKNEKKIDPVKTEIQKISEQISFSDLDNQNQSELLKIQNENNRMRFGVLLKEINRLGYETVINVISDSVININSLTGNQGVIDTKSSKTLWESTSVPDTIRGKGLKWGGDFSNYFEPVKVEIPQLGYDSTRTLSESITYTEEEVQEKITVQGYVGIDIEKALSNLKVNKVVFNFFLKMQQYDLDTYIKNSKL